MKDSSLKAKVMSGMFWRFGERICAQLVSFGVSIILARLLSPNEFGTVSLLLVFIEIANVFVVNGLGSALVQKKNADEVDFSTVFHFSVIFSCVLYLLLFILAKPIADFLENDSLVWLLRVLSLKIPLAGINSIQQAYVQKHMIFKKFFFSTIIGTVFSGAIGVFMAMMGMGPWALIGQYLTNSVIDTVVLFITVRWRPKLVFSIKRMSALIDFGWKILAASLLNTVYTNIQSIVIGKKYTSADLAYYNQGMKIPQMLVTNVNSAVTTVMFPAMSEKQDELETLKSILRKTIQLTSMLMWPSMLGLMVLSEKIVLLLWGERWIQCVPFFWFACIQFALGPITMANLQAIKALGRSDLTLKMEIIKKGYGIVALLISMRYGVIAIALAAITQSFFALGVNTYPNRKLLNYNYSEQISDTLPAICMSILMGIGVYIIGNVLCVVNDFMLLIIQIIMGILLYVMIMYIFKRDDLKYILSLIKVYKR